MPLDEISLFIVGAGAVAALGFLLGMFMLHHVTEMGKRFDRKPPRLPGLTPEQTFGLGGVAMIAAILLISIRH
jgi:hypothetical protein